MVEGTGIDVAHHVLVGTFGQTAALGLPIADVGLVVIQQHIGTHRQQGVLGSQAGTLVTFGGLPHVLKRGPALSQLLFRGIIPGFTQLVGNIEVVVQMGQIGHHVRIILLARCLHNLIP